MSTTTTNLPRVRVRLRFPSLPRLRPEEEVTLSCFVGALGWTVAAVMRQGDGQGVGLEAFAAGALLVVGAVRGGLRINLRVLRYLVSIKRVR